MKIRFSLGMSMILALFTAKNVFAAVGDYSNVEIGYVASNEENGHNYIKIIGTNTSCNNSLVKIPTKEMLSIVLAAQSQRRSLIRLVIKTIPLEPISNDSEANSLLGSCGCQAVWASQ